MRTHGAGMRDVLGRLTLLMPAMDGGVSYLVGQLAIAGGIAFLTRRALGKADRERQEAFEAERKERGTK